MLGRNLVLKLIAKNGSKKSKNLIANEISVFFNHQYFGSRLITGFDFWHEDRDE